MAATISINTDAWNSEEIFTSGQSYFSSLFLAIQQAQRSIWIETYILRDDPVGAGIVELLEQAAAKGLDVRLMIDGIGSQEWIAARLHTRKAPRFPLRVYNAVNAWKVLKMLGLLHWRSFWIEFRRSSRRTHRKLVIIDRELAYVGSMNLCAEPVESIQGGRAWRDTAARVKGPGLELLCSTFERVWGGQRIKFNRAEEHWTRIIRDNATARQRFRNHRKLLRELRQAKRRVWVTAAYFVPVRSFRRELRAAARRNVDVRVIVPGVSDVFFLPWVSRQFFGRLLRSGVRIFEFQNRMIHAKTIIIDDSAWIGSSNLNGRSLYWDMELDVRVSRSESLARLSSQFEEDQQQSVEFRGDRIGRWLGIPRLIGRFLLKFSRHI